MIIDLSEFIYISKIDMGFWLNLNCYSIVSR